jgi:hypothetical protein
MTHRYRCRTSQIDVFNVAFKAFILYLEWTKETTVIAECQAFQPRITSRARVDLQKIWRILGPQVRNLIIVFAPQPYWPMRDRDCLLSILQCWNTETMVQRGQRVSVRSYTRIVV